MLDSMIFFNSCKGTCLVSLLERLAKKVLKSFLRLWISWLLGFSIGVFFVLQGNLTCAYLNNFLIVVIKGFWDMIVISSYIISPCR